MQNRIIILNELLEYISYFNTCDRNSISVYIMLHNNLELK